MYRYAQIDSEGRVISDSYLNGAVEKDDMIAVAEDFDLIGKKYADGQWVEAEEETPEVEAITENEIIQAEMLLNQQEIMIAQTEILKNLGGEG